jgi:hypothetical protein
VFRKSAGSEENECFGRGWNPAFTSQELSACRSEDGSYNFKIKLVASMFADETSFPNDINLRDTLEEIETSISGALPGFTRIESLLNTQKQYLKNKVLSHTNEIVGIFELSGTPNCRIEGFDCEGDDDILKINFGGKNVEI